MSPRKVVVVSTRSLSPAVTLIRFASGDGKSWAFEPGQWINIRLPDDPPAARRAYSLAGETQDGGFELAVTEVPGGVLSPRLVALLPGDQAVADGPHGFFTRRGHEGEPSLFVAAGSGVAPVRPMLQAALAEAAPAVPLTLLFGCRSQQDMLFGDEFSLWAQQYPRFRYETTLSRADDRWTGRTGYVQAHVDALIAESPPTHVYICGLSAMVAAVRATLKARGLDRKQIHSERFD